MNYSELVQAVVETTERGESVPRIQLAIAKATLKFHAADFWLRDIIQTVVNSAGFDNLAPRYQISVSAQLPRFRKISYIQGYDDTNTPGMITGAYHESSPMEIKDRWGRLNYETFYLAGDTLTIFSGFQPPAFLIGHFSFPKVGETDYNSWIADYLPHVIIDEASAEIFGSVGDADEAQRRRAMFADNLRLLRINEVEAEAR